MTKDRLNKALAGKFRSKEQITKDIPELKGWAEELKSVFGSYAGVKVMEGKNLVYSWEKKETPVKPTNRILNPGVWTYIKPPVGTFFMPKKEKKSVKRR